MRAFCGSSGRQPVQVTTRKNTFVHSSVSFLDFTFCFISVCAFKTLTDCRNFDAFFGFTILFYQRLRVFGPRILDPSVLDFYLMIYQRLRVFRILDPSVVDFYLMIYQRLRVFRSTGPRPVSSAPHAPAAAGRRPRRLVVPEITPPEQMEIQACVHSRTQPHSPRSESSAASSYRKSPHPDAHSKSGLCTIMHKRNKIYTKIIRIGTLLKRLLRFL